jgi:hypothetical protein
MISESVDPEKERSVTGRHDNRGAIPAIKEEQGDEDNYRS